ERLFCHLLGELGKQRPDFLTTLPGWRWLHEKLVLLNRLGKLNCLLSDGERLFCYHDRGGWKGLSYCSVYILGQGRHHFEDPTMCIDVEGEAKNRGIVVASQPLSEARWRPFRVGEMIVLENGRIRFSSHRDYALDDAEDGTE